MKKTTAKKLVLSAITGSVLVASQMAGAHTRLQTPSIDENSASHGSDYNNEVISHGCANPDSGLNDTNTVATVVVFPDGVDSSITVNGEASDKTLLDFVSNWGSPVQKIQSNDIFNIEDEIKDPLGNVLGYWAGSTDGTGLQGGLTGVVPFRTSGVVIEPTSCAKSVKFIVAIADICKLTNVAGFNNSTAQLWTPAVGSMFDGIEGESKGYNSPASLTVNRTSALPEACGEGVDVVVTPSAAQLNRDMTVEINGAQVWPLAD
ncbi:MAG: hypothetical protein KAJ63_06240 [Methyloprofundus sp.]|nr:hypothetical protein [Methyloprofundus sp.]